MPFCKTENFSTAKELLEALRRSNERWELGPRRWIFRGQADDSWELLPSALRKNQTKLTHHPKRPAGPYSCSQLQIGQEIEMVFDFIFEANYRGLPIPGNAAEVIRLLNQDRLGVDRDDNWDRFPREETIEAFALAQHHGIPTRLLDWTRNSFTAAYFAASEAAKALNKENAAERMGIWCFCTDILWYLPQTKKNERIVLVDPPRAANPNLLAQNGVFTFHQHAIALKEPPLVKPFNQVAEDLYSSVANNLTGHMNGAAFKAAGAPLCLLTLPTSQSRFLLNLLADEDVTASKLFPGYDGVVRELYERLELRQEYQWPPSST